MQHTQRCNWEEWRDQDKFYAQLKLYNPKQREEVLRSRRKEIRYEHLTCPPRWIIETIKREFGLDKKKDKHDAYEIALKYQRENREKYPPMEAWNHLPPPWHTTFAMALECMSWCKEMMEKLADLVYQEDCRQKELEA